MKYFSLSTKLITQVELAKKLMDCFLKFQNLPILFFYSGGSAFEVYGLLADKLVEHKYFNNKVMFAPMDERYDEKGSNYLEFSKIDAFEKFKSLGFQFVETVNKGKSLNEVSTWYEEWVRKEIIFIKDNDGLVFGVWGMGEDGHTAGIFADINSSDFEEKFNSDNYVVGYDVGIKSEFSERFSLTFSALNQLDRSFGYVVGENKKRVLERAKSGDNLAEMPVRFWLSQDNCELYTDSLG